MRDRPADMAKNGLGFKTLERPGETRRRCETDRAAAYLFRSAQPLGWRGRRLVDILPPQIAVSGLHRRRAAGFLFTGRNFEGAP
jgi:hypothetical protein